MGLGKTLQMVCFCDIFLRHTSSKKILLIMPINTLQNWLNEFNMWLPLPEDVDKCPLQSDGEVRPRTFKIFVLNESLKSLTARSKVVLDWSEQGGVLIMGYEMYRLLSLRKTRTKRKKGIIVDTTTSRDREMFEGIFEALVNPGPDLVVCDEGHRIKNSVATTSHALKQIKTKRRVVLTGYPLQNNLLEYWCMVDFVRPSYLGTRNEFCNMFERPIQNGQCIDSTPNDFKLMRYRAHVLHSLLKGFVQRRSHTVLQKSLPDKTEFVILVRMTKFQRKLYEVFMNEVVRSRKVPNPLKAFAVCCKIWNHPDVLYTFLKKREADLDLEVDDEAESVNKKETSKSNSVKSTVKPIVEPVIETKSVEDESKIKPPLSVDSAYSSTQSSYDSNNSFYNNYQQTYDNQQQQYPNWNGKYYQENSYYSQGNYFSSNSSQSSYYSNNSNYQSFNSHSDTSSQQQQQQKIPEKIGGLLEDVIEKEKEEENNKELSSSRNSKDDGIPYDWAVELMKDYVPDLLENSPKLELFFCVLDESIRIGDRILVFSQSLLTLNLLEKFLQKSQIPGQDKNFAKNTSYFRLDGCTTALEREKLINEFNKNEDVKLFLVSTRAGSLGINLVGANRVIVFDASWNPCHDTQAVCRVYRYGQSKKCFVYRFVMDNCLEKKIYDRQINKQGMADRIVDECNPDAHLSMKEVTSLCYEDGEDPDVKDFNEIIDNYEDVIAKKILQNHYKSLTKEPFSHESLLVDRKEKKLSVAEKRLAQRGYEMEKQAANKPSYNYNANIRMYRTTDGSLIQRPVGSVRIFKFNIISVKLKYQLIYIGSTNCIRL
jgi:RAD54-like protein 2